MSQCLMCVRKPTKQRIIDPLTNICIECIKKIATINATNSKSSDGMNEYLAQSNYSAVNRNNSVTDSSIFDSINPADNTNSLDDEYLDKPVSELCVRDIFNIVSGANKP